MLFQEDELVVQRELGGGVGEGRSEWGGLRGRASLPVATLTHIKEDLWKAEGQP